MKYTGNSYTDRKVAKKKFDKTLFNGFYISVICLVICIIIGLWLKHIYFFGILLVISATIGVISGLVSMSALPINCHREINIMNGKKSKKL